MEEKTNGKGVSFKGVIKRLAFLGLIILFSWLLVTYVGQRTVVEGDSMNDTLKDGDNLIMDKLSYRLHEPERFDIIIFPHREDDGKEVNFIKRIIGLPGEKIQIIDGLIFINDKMLNENFGKETMAEGGCAIDPVYLGEDEYFVLGDNRNNSTDSRALNAEGQPIVGAVKRSAIVGKAFFRFFPFAAFGLL